MPVVVVLVVVVFVAVDVAGFLLVVVGCAEVLCCDADASRRGPFMRFSLNQNNDLAGVVPHLPILKKKRQNPQNAIWDL